MGGAFPFSGVTVKPSLSWSELVTLMIKRGLVVGDQEACARFLAATNYYRFSGYARYFQVAPHFDDNRFVEGTTFSKIRALYEADEDVRMALFASLSRIELMLRSHVAHVIALEYGAYHRYLEADFYTDLPGHETTVEHCWRDIDRSKDRHILHYRGEGSDGADFSELPVWSAVEAWSFGTLSRVIERGGRGALSDAVAVSIGAAKAGFAYRVRALVYLRNRCAHHGRLWNHFVIDAGPTPNNVRSRAKRTFGQFEPRSVIDVVASLDDLAARGNVGGGLLSELFEEYGQVPDLWAGLAKPQAPRDHESGAKWSSF